MGIAEGPDGSHTRAVVTRPLEDPYAVVRRRLVPLLHRELRLDAFFEAADRVLVSVLPYDSSCWLSLDPATLLPTGHFTWHVEGDHLVAMAANEYLEDDVNKFAVLAGASLPVGILSTATGGDLARSARYRQLLADHGYRDGDELRATFLEGDTVWGCVAIHRRVGWFSEAEGRLVGDVGGYLANGIRRAILPQRPGAPRRAAPTGTHRAGLERRDRKRHAPGPRLARRVVRLDPRVGGGAARPGQRRPAGTARGRRNDG